MARSPPGNHSGLPIGYPEACKDILLGDAATIFGESSSMMEEVAVYDRAMIPAEGKPTLAASGVTKWEKSDCCDSPSRLRSGAPRNV